MDVQHQILCSFSLGASDGLKPSWLQATWSCWIDLCVLVQGFDALLLGIYWISCFTVKHFKTCYKHN